MRLTPPKRCDRWLAAVQRSLGAVELGEHTLANTWVVDVAVLDRVLDAAA